MEERVSAVETRLLKLEADVSEILKFVTGANKILGVAAKQWKNVILFGAGIMTSAGIGNPAVWTFIGKFFGS